MRGVNGSAVGADKLEKCRHHLVFVEVGIGAFVQGKDDLGDPFLQCGGFGVALKFHAQIRGHLRGKKMESRDFSLFLQTTGFSLFRKYPEPLTIPKASLRVVPGLRRKTVQALKSESLSSAITHGVGAPMIALWKSR